jgi:hypothetical protein
MANSARIRPSATIYIELDYDEEIGDPSQVIYSEEADAIEADIKEGGVPKDSV